MNLKGISSAVLLCSTHLSFAGTAGPVGDVSPSVPKYYVGIEGGASISAETHFEPQLGQGNRNVFIAPNNSDWSRDLGTTGFGGLFAGYIINPNVALQLSWDYRSGYDYNLQATYGIDANDPNYFAQDRFQTLGDIKIQTFLFDLILKPEVNWGGFVPYVKGGVGLSYNQMGTLRNVQMAFNSNSVAYDIRLAGDSVTSFAWDAGVGVDYFFNSNVNIGLGYRLVDAGKLRTSNAFYDPVRATVSTISPFETKHFYLNELVASMAYHFDYA
ncbi:OmpA-like transmembrane domain protein [Legionella moravica]|uniref:OmpA-like transmembrane domain protein n=1 Tax=Legionella moravica TaxID=39962 RepID=A0A378JUY0_9GAMM|nr:outer membrane beta-barrel protein [Legionella moravica]KTD31674.1 OmpA-like transmembrane domain protein [Legionella moravica]STX62246.1 Opacity protein and related surface antigens [Legionella moravica]